MTNKTIYSAVLVFISAIGCFSLSYASNLNQVTINNANAQSSVLKIKNLKRDTEYNLSCELNLVQPNNYYSTYPVDITFFNEKGKTIMSHFKQSQSQILAGPLSTGLGHQLMVTISSKLLPPNLPAAGTQATLSCKVLS